MGAESPRVSVVVPSYNHARYLEAAIESVLAQDYPQVELIVIDDGSTDGSRDVLEKYRGRFRCEAQPNQGQAFTVNRGWRLSRGEILAYLSADDVLLPGAASAAVEALRQHGDAVLAYCDFDLIGPDSQFVRHVRAPDFDYREMVGQMVCPPGPGAFFRRTAFDRTDGWRAQYRQYGDYELWLRLARQGRFVRIPRVLAAFRVHPASQSFAPSPRQAIEEPVLLMEDFFRDAPDCVRDLRAQALSTANVHRARLLVRAGHYREGFAACARAAALSPGNLVSWRMVRIVANALFNRLGHRLLWRLRRRAPG
jgi:glycosyltransferase involved in cell wall biosynthesis